MIQTPEAIETLHAAPWIGEHDPQNWERHARALTTNLLRMAGGTRSNPAREPVKTAVLRAVQRDARLVDLQRDLEAMPMTVAIARTFRRVAPHPLLQLPVSSDEAETLTRAWAFEVGLEVSDNSARRVGADASAADRANDPVSSFIVAMLLEMTGMEIAGPNLQYLRRVAAVAVYSSANYDEFIEALWCEPSLDEFVMRLRYLRRPSAMSSLFGGASLESRGLVCNA